MLSSTTQSLLLNTLNRNFASFIQPLLKAEKAAEQVSANSTKKPAEPENKFFFEKKSMHRYFDEDGKEREISEHTKSTDDDPKKLKTVRIKKILPSKEGEKETQEELTEEVTDFDTYFQKQEKQQQIEAEKPQKTEKAQEKPPKKGRWFKRASKKPVEDKKPTTNVKNAPSPKHQKMVPVVPMFDDFFGFPRFGAFPRFWFDDDDFDDFYNLPTHYHLEEVPEEEIPAKEVKKETKIQEEKASLKGAAAKPKAMKETKVTNQRKKQLHLEWISVRDLMKWIREWK